MTALHLAAKYGNLEACHYIMTLGNGSKFINAQDDGGWTPLVWGCEHQRFDIVKFVCYVVSRLKLRAHQFFKMISQVSTAIQS